MSTILMNLFTFSVPFCSYLHNCSKDSRCICNVLIVCRDFWPFSWHPKGVYCCGFFCLVLQWHSQNCWRCWHNSGAHHYLSIQISDFWSFTSVIDLKFCIFPFIGEEQYVFLIADRLLAIVFRILVSNYIFAYLEHDIRSFTL